jgi:hypothetical protein
LGITILSSIAEKLIIVTFFLFSGQLYNILAALPACGRRKKSF